LITKLQKSARLFSRFKKREIQN